MDVKEVLTMVGGEGETSFAKNSVTTRKVISITKPLIEKSIQDLYCKQYCSSKVLSIADLGCSSGPNTLSVISTLVKGVAMKCRELGRQLPDLQVFLNDLPANDFNSVFKGLPAFYKELNEEIRKENGSPCFIAGVPGSFHERLFPANTLHFVHSSYSVHWLSQVPGGLDSGEGLLINKGKIYISKTSPPCVREAYLKQFQKDFSLFLKSRSEEMVPNGCMVLILHGRKAVDPSSREGCYAWERLAQALAEMVSEGLVKAEKVDSFNVPYYIPLPEEVQDGVEREGSFIIEQIETFSIEAGQGEEDKWLKGLQVSKSIRSFTEPMISHHFGEGIIEKLYEKLTHILVEDLAKEKTKTISIVVVLRRKG